MTDPGTFCAWIFAGVGSVYAAVLALWHWSWALPACVASEAWTALAWDFAHGELYRPVGDALGYGGTRYVPVFFVLHGLLLKLGAEPVLAGAALVLASAAALTAGLFALLREHQVPARTALPVAAIALAGSLFHGLCTTIRGDHLASALAVWSLVFVTRFARNDGRRELVAAGVCLVGAAFTKWSDLYFLPLTMCFLWRLERRAAAIGLGAGVTAATLACAALVEVVSEGRFSENLRLFASGSTSSEAFFLRFPWRFLRMLAVSYPDLGLVALLAAIAALFRRHAGREIYTLLFVTLILAAGANAQRLVGSTYPVKPKNASVFAQSQSHLNRTSSTDDTLSAHFTGTEALYGSQGGGFVCGHNGYGDIAKMQLFDASYGVSGPGVITGILFYMGWVEGNSSSVITATIWDDNAGTPGTILGTVNIPFSAMDTTMAGYYAIVNAPGPAFYNGVGVFGTPVPIPASGNFWAGFSFTYAAGDTVGLVSTTDPTGGDAPGITGDFPDAATHTWEQWSDNSFNSFNAGSGTWQLDIALGVFPTVSFGVGIQEPASSNGFSLSQNHPNPAGSETVVSYSLDKTASVSFTVTDVMGRVVRNMDNGNEAQGNHRFTLDTRSLNSGVYFITMNADGTRLTTRMMVSK